MRKVIIEKGKFKKNDFNFNKVLHEVLLKAGISIHVLEGCALNILNPTILNSEFSLNYVNV